MGLAVVISILAGYADDIGYAFSLSRTLYFLPFFLLGFLHGRTLLRWFSSHCGMAAALLVGSITVALIGVHRGMPHTLLYGSMGYSLTGPHEIEPGLERVLIFVLSTCASFGFAGVALIRSQLAAWLGRCSLTIFVIHGFAVIAVGKMWKIFAPSASAPMLLALLALAAAIAIGLALLDPYFNATFRWAADRVRHVPLRDR